MSTILYWLALPVVLVVVGVAFARAILGSVSGSASDRDGFGRGLNC
jgi:hypothetical protein